MRGEREQVLKDVLEKTAAEIKTLSLTVDTMCMGLERESVEPQVTASLKAIGMGLDHTSRTSATHSKLNKKQDKA